MLFRFLTALAGVLLLTEVAHAEPLRAHGALGVGHATSGHQKDEYSWGAGAWGGLEYPFVRQLGLELSASWLGLSDGDPAADEIKPESGASAVSAALGLRVIPFAASHNGALFSPAGLWAKGGGGLAFTNGLTRPMLEAQLGFDLLNASGRMGLGPMASWVHVFQPDDEFRPADANVVLFGIHGLYDFATEQGPIGDRDGDGIKDNVDRCPDTPEDKDGFQDTDGCPDNDNDNDGIPDKVDRCPMDPEDRDKFEDEDGCPEKDNDKDGILDRADKCPNDPEDPDGWDSLDGCPDPDNDADGILDVNDLCPFEPETVNGYADNDGCPDEEQVRVVGDKIVLDDRVHFFVNSAVIRKVSYPLLQRLTKLVAEHPEYTHISVEGHADERGPEDFNKKLSEDRAKSVMDFMIKAGIARDRLSYQGFGATKPLVDKKNEYAWLLNRRVEFTVTRQMRHGGSASSSTGVNVPSENNVPKEAAPPATPAPTAPPPAAPPPPSGKPGDNERETPTPPPEAGQPSKSNGQAPGGAAK
jgi:outer membrane protein OmpA-like peptidoglycan-associated protein